MKHLNFVAREFDNQHELSSASSRRNLRKAEEEEEEKERFLNFESIAN